MNDRSSRPTLADKDADIDVYDTILLGFPIWWYVAPTIINSFLEAYDFSGKKIILFATSGGSGFGKTVDGLKDSVSAGTTIVEGKLLNGRWSMEELKKWVDGIL
jgi:flavodoxin